jgi:Flp pilus assembly CpaE family ATPase
MNRAVIQILDQRTRERDSKKTVLDHAANELVFAVVGHVGSGTSEVAQKLASLLSESSPGIPAHDVEIY